MALKHFVGKETFLRNAMILKTLSNRGRKGRDSWFGGKNVLVRGLGGDWE